MQNKEVIKEFKAIIEKAKRHRVSSGISQAQVGKIMADNESRDKAYGRAYISLIESGDINISMYVFLNYCKAIGYKPFI